jgi:hypothetical protein
MKVRVGFGLGVQGLRKDGTLPELVDSLEGNGFDSLWLSERLTGDAPDPLVGLAFAAGRTTKLKLGTSVQVLPGRNPALVAKEWASLDRLSGGRALPAFGLGVADPREQQAFGVVREERASSRPTCGWAVGPRASCAASVASATAGCPASRPRPRSRRDGCSSRRRPSRPTGRSRSSTSAPW